MAVITKQQRDRLKKELQGRYVQLLEHLGGRDLSSANEGCRRGHWSKPEMLCWVDAMDLSLALGDFKTILGEIAKIKS